jgi:hypothetical protein
MVADMSTSEVKPGEAVNNKTEPVINKPTTLSKAERLEMMKRLLRERQREHNN